MWVLGRNGTRRKRNETIMKRGDWSLVVGKQVKQATGIRTEFQFSVCLTWFRRGEIISIRKGTFKHCNVYMNTQPNIDTFTVRTETNYSRRLKQVPTETVQITWYFAQRIHSVDNFRQVNIRSFLCSTYEFEKKFLKQKKKSNLIHNHQSRTLSTYFFLIRLK